MYHMAKVLIQPIYSDMVQIPSLIWPNTFMKNNSTSYFTSVWVEQIETLDEMWTGQQLFTAIYCIKLIYTELFCFNF